MNGNDISRRVKREYGDSAGSQIVDQDIIDWINDGQEDIARATDCLVGLTLTTLSANTREINLPTNAYKVLRISVDENKLLPTSIQKLNQRYSGGDWTILEGDPYEYYVDADKVYFFPMPTRDLSVSVETVNLPTEITNLSQTPQIPKYFHRTLVDWCLAHASSFDGDVVRYDRFMGRYQERLAKDISEFNSLQSEHYSEITDLEDEFSLYGYY